MASVATAFPETYGWDTVFALTLDAANRILSRMPTNGRYSATIPTSAGTAELSWSFGQWEITNVPGGGSIEVTIPFATGSKLITTLTGQPAVERPVDTNAYACKISFEAVFNNSTGQLVAVTAGQWADVTIVTPPGFGADNRLSLGTILQQWFDFSPEAAALFSKELMVLDMTSDVGTKVPWLVPRKLGFAGGLMADGSTRAIGIMALVAGSETADLGRLQLSPLALPANAEAGFFMSRQLVMKNLFGPAIAATYAGDQSDDLNKHKQEFESSYTIDADDGAVTNRVPLSTSLDVDGKSRTCTIDAGNLKSWLDGRFLHMTLKPMTVSTDISTVFIDATILEQLELSLLPLASAPGASNFVLNSVDPQISLSKSNSEGLTIGTIIGGVAVTLLLGALAVWTPKGVFMNVLKLSERSAKIWARVVVAAAGVAAGLGVALGPYLATKLRNSDVNEVPSLDPLLDAALGALQWPEGGRTKFVATSATFANGIMMAVKLEMP